jgi:hypothetical protein
VLGTLVAHGYFDQWVALPDDRNSSSSSGSDISALRADESVALSLMESEKTRHGAEVRFRLPSFSNLLNTFSFLFWHLLK